MPKLFFIFLVSFVTFVGSLNIVKAYASPNPEIIALNACAGGLWANTFFSYAIGNLSEERARTSHSLINWGLFLAEREVLEWDEVTKHAEKYSEYFNLAYGSTVTKLDSGTFTWDDQAEIDKCQTRIFGPFVRNSVNNIKTFEDSDQYFRQLEFSVKDYRKNFQDRVDILRATQ